MTASPRSLLGHTSPVPASHDVSAGLRRSYLFEDLTSEDIRPLAAVATTRDLVRGEWLCHLFVSDIAPRSRVVSASMSEGADQQQ
jgi:hypothetical protein